MKGSEKQIKWAEDIKASTATLRKIAGHDITAAMEWAIETNHAWAGNEQATDEHIAIANKMCKAVIDDIARWDDEQSAKAWIDYRNEIKRYGYAPSTIDVPHVAAAVSMIVKAWAKAYAPTILADVEARCRETELAARANKATLRVQEMVNRAIDGRIDSGLFGYGVDNSYWAYSSVGDRWWR